MASYLDKEKINTAITDNVKLDLSHVHITTGNFMQLAPIYNKEMVPGEKIDVNVESFSRMNPMPVPTFGRADIKNRAYFVPFRTIFRGWNDFITDAPHANSMNNTELFGNLLSSVPTVSNDALIHAFTQVSYVFNGGSMNGAVIVSDSAAAYDFQLFDASSGTVAHWKYTSIGRQIKKILESLGYKVNWNTADQTKYSALPLLAFAKVYIDWYFPSAYTNVAEYNYIKMLCNFDTGVTLNIDKVSLGRILQFCYTCYDSDYFVSAWDNPNSPNTDTYSSNFNLVNIDSVSKFYSGGGSRDVEFVGGVTNNSAVNNLSSSNSLMIGGANAPFINPGSQNTSNTRSGVTLISEYVLHSLHALTDYLKRHQLAGSRAMDRYLARFGKALPAEKLNRSVYLGSQIVPIQFGDIMSTSDTTGAVLGDYAGKGLAYGDNGNFSWSTDEYGMFIVVSTITPATGYYQGIDRNVKHISKLDFWTPEFDSLGTQAITADELYVTDYADASSGYRLSANGIHDSIFGFTPRYAEYKVGRDQVTGNFRVPSLNGDVSTNNGSASWHLMRMFDDGDFVDASGNTDYRTIKHSVNFVYSRMDTGQYNRIFYDTSANAADQFTLIHNFNVASWSPMKPLYDSYEFEDMGRKVTLDVNGVKHN